MPFSNFTVRQVDVTSAFWGVMQQRVSATTIPAIFDAQKTHNHWRCLTWKEGHEPKPHQFWDSDIYKAVEAACWSMIKLPDAEIMAVVEEAVDMIRAAQHPDGYINSYYTVHGVGKRWTNLRDDHELYCMGHLLEAAVAYETLTSSGRLHEVAIKICKHLDSQFGVEAWKKQGYPGHQEIELGLLRLYEFSGDPLPLKLARYFILERGKRDKKGENYYDHEAFARGGDPYDFMGAEMKAWYHSPRDYAYQQADEPLMQTTEVKGHAVRAMYYYTAATDLVRLSDNGDTEVAKLKTTLDRLWRNLVDCKLYVTGGVGSDRQNEGFARPYQLPDLEDEGCYAETCAAFALIHWCNRLLQLELKSEYGDIMEIALYNAFLGAMNVGGDAFYYQNVLRTLNGTAKSRSKWFGVACCPPNVAKLLANIGSMLYSYDRQRDMLIVHHYVESKLSAPETKNTLLLRTSIPWSGNTTIRVERSCKLALRIPSWTDKWTCSLKGEMIDGYLYIDGPAGEDITLDFLIEPRCGYTNIKSGRDDVCILRGPLVYCFEGVDNADVEIDLLKMLDTPIRDGDKVAIPRMGKVQTVVATGMEFGQNHSGGNALYPAQPWKAEKRARDIVSIPYFLRANRGGSGAMRVWMPRAGMSTVNVR